MRRFTVRVEDKAKLGAKKLSRVLEKIDKYEDPDLLVGFDSHDDASVLKITEDKGIVSTLDFFPPMVKILIFMVRLQLPMH